jgi:tetratricopeptide (TPR) repeat protein
MYDLGSEHPHTLLSMNNLAASYSKLGRHEEAMDLRKKTKGASQKTLGSEHPDTLLSVNNVAASYSKLGRHEAMDLREKTLEARQRTQGCEHPDTLTSMYNLASSYSRLGRHKEAIELSRKAFEGRKRILGSDRHRTLESGKQFEIYNNRSNEVWILSSVLAIIYEILNFK